jgi:hypothetical protein
MSSIEEAGVTEQTKGVRMDSTKRAWRHLVASKFHLTSPSRNATKAGKVDMESLLGPAGPCLLHAGQIKIQSKRRIRQETNPITNYWEEY